MSSNGTKEITGTVLNPVSNDGELAIDVTAPYYAEMEVTGTCPILFHRWSNEAVAEKAASARGSAAKKTDNIESYVTRDANGVICLPGEYLRQSIIMAGQWRTDPRNSRKSMKDLLKAAIQTTTEMAPITTVTGHLADTWDYLDARRAKVQGAGITRSRPAFLAGWSARVTFLVLQPQYVDSLDLLSLATQAGQLVGVADFRPTYGRFAVTSFDVGLGD